jgi:hypothetical protein
MRSLAHKAHLENKSEDYWTFYDYAREYQFKRLFGVGTKGEITLRGSFRAMFPDYKYWVMRFLKTKGFWYEGAEKSLKWKGTSSNWVVRLKPFAEWTSEIYTEFLRYQMQVPLFMRKGNLSLTVRSMDWNFDSVRKGDKISDKIVLGKLHLLKTPFDWMTAKGGRFMKGEDKYDGENCVLGEILLEGHEAVVKFTLSYFSVNAELVNELKIGTYTVVELLARVGRLAMVNRLIHGKLKLCGNVLFREDSFERVWSAVFAAVESDNAKYLQEAVALGTKSLLHIRGERGITALGLSVMNNQLELVKVLLKAYVNVDQPSWCDETAICLALHTDASTEVIRELVKAGANISGKDSTGNSISDQLKTRGIFVG